MKIKHLINWNDVSRQFIPVFISRSRYRLTLTVTVGRVPNFWHHGFFIQSLTAVASTTQRECSFGGGADGITEQLQRIRVSFLLDNKVGPRERRESLWSLQIRFTWKSMRKLRQLWLVDTVFVSLFELIEASHRVHTANEVNCHAVLHARRVFHFILLKPYTHSSQKQ